jgi:hypothetical protein
VIKMGYTETLNQIVENQKKKLMSLTFYEVIMLIGRVGQVYGGLILIDYGAKMYDAGQSLPFVADDPRSASLFIMVLLAITFMSH